MKRSIALGAAVAALAFLVASCAGVPSPAPEAPAPAPVAKERIEVYKVPVLAGEKSFLADGTLDRTVAYSLNEAKTEVVRRTVVESVRPEPVETLVRDLAPGRVVETLTDYEGQVISRKTIELNAAGRKVRETVEGSKSVKGTVSEWDYDPAGNMTEWRVRNAAGALLAITKYQYEGGRLSVARMLDPAGAFEGKLEYAYGPDGLVAARVLSDAAGKVERTEKFLYKDKVLVEESYYKGAATLERRVIHEIGPEGVPLSSIVHDGAGRVREKRAYEYAYREESRTVVYYE